MSTTIIRLGYPEYSRVGSRGDDISRLVILQPSTGFDRHVHHRLVGSTPAWAVEEFRFQGCQMYGKNRALRKRHVKKLRRAFWLRRRRRLER